MKIEIKKVTEEILNKHQLKIENQEKFNFRNIDFIICYDNNKELGFAIITPKDNFDLDNLFKYNFESLYSYSEEEFNSLFLTYKDILKECNYLNYIEVYDKNKGIGSLFIDRIKNIYKSLWLYSVIDAENFYIKNNFYEIVEGDHNFYIKQL